MSDVTNILIRIESGDPSAAEKLLPLVYEDLRKLAALKMVHERADHSLQPTALVHEAYLRLIGDDSERGWDSRRHFFAAAAESMRRILVEDARQKKRIKRGGEFQRISLPDLQDVDQSSPEELIDLDHAIQKLQAEEPEVAEIVTLRFFAGLSSLEIAEMMDTSEVTVRRKWRYARAWLHREMNES